MHATRHCIRSDALCGPQCHLLHRSVHACTRHKPVGPYRGISDHRCLPIVPFLPAHAHSCEPSAAPTQLPCMSKLAGRTLFRTSCLKRRRTVAQDLYIRRMSQFNTQHDTAWQIKDQHGTSRLGAVHVYSAARHSTARRSTQHAIAQHGMAQSGVSRSGVSQHGSC